MPVQAVLSFTQNLITPGPGVSMVGVSALPVTLTSVFVAGALSHTFEMLDVPLTSGVPTGLIYSGPLNTCQFTPDAPPGCYRVRLSVQGGDGSVRQQIRNFALPTAVGNLILPSFRAVADELNFPGNTEGWEQILNEWLLYLLANSTGAGTTTEFIYTDSGLPPVGPVYGIWSDLMAAVGALPNGALPIITFVQSCTIPAAGMPPGGWFQNLAVWRSYLPATGVVTVSVPDGVTIDMIGQITYGLVVEASPTTADGTSFTWSAYAPGTTPWILIVGQGAALRNSGTKALVLSPGAMAQQYVVFAMFQSAINAVAPSTAEIIKGQGTDVILGVQSQCGPYGGLPDGWVTGSAGCVLVYQNSVDSSHPIVPGWLGAAPLIVNSTRADNLNYDDTLAAPVTGSSNVQEICDWLKGQTFGGAGLLYVWDGAKTWAQVYAAVQAGGGFGVVLVPNDSSKEMTPEGGGNPTNLSGIYFLGLQDADGNLPTIDIDSLGVGGFILDRNPDIHSKDIFWNAYYEIGNGPSAAWEFDGGGFYCVNAANAWRGNPTARAAFRVKLRNRAYFNGTNCTDAIASFIRGGAEVELLTGGRLGTKSIKNNAVLPAWPAATVTKDASGVMDPGAFQGTFAPYTIVLLDAASQVTYDDTLALPATGSANVQAICDWLKTNAPAMVGDPNTAAYFDGAGVLTDDLGLLFGGLDPYGRPQIRDIRQGTLPAANAVWRQGAWQVDGDPQNIEGDGVVVYGKAPNGLQDASNGAFARIKCDRFDIRLIIGAVDVGYGFRADLTETYYKDNTGAQTMNITRATGKAWFGELAIASAAGPRVLTGVGSPEGIVVGSPGDFYLNTSGGVNTVYAKQSGVSTNTGWVALSASASAGTTAEGGFFITAINDTGAASIKGHVLHPSTVLNGAVSKCPVGDNDPIGVMYDAGVANGQLARVVVGGWADVLVQAGYNITREYWVGAPGAFVAPPGVAGLAQTNAAAPATVDHFREIGHCLDDQLPKPLLVDTLARCVLHFN